MTALRDFVDTLAIKGRYSLRSELPAGCTFTLPAKLIRGVRVKVDSSGWIVTRVECSLPKIVFGHNGRLIENQTQMDNALDSLHKVLNTIAYMPSVENWRPYRIDFAWNFNLPVAPLLRSQYCLIIPGFRNEATLHKGGEGITWLSAKSKLKVVQYDKAKQMRVEGEVLRAEVSFCGEKLHKYLKGRDWKSWQVLWSMFHEVMSSIPPVLKPSRDSDWQEALGQEPVEIRERVLSRLTHRGRKTFRGYKQRVEAAAANFSETFSWAKILSPNGPPQAVHVFPKPKKSKCHEILT